MARPSFLHLSRRVMQEAFIAAMLCLAACAPFSGPYGSRIPPEIKYWSAPAVLPGVRPEMKTGGFWIGQIDEPDRILLDEQGIEGLNRDIRNRLGFAEDIARLPGSLDSRSLRGEFTYTLSRFRDRGPFFSRNGRQADSAFYKEMERQMNIAALPSPRITIGFGLATAATDQRRLPTSDALFAIPGDFDFDRLQNNSLDIGTPVAVLHKSLHGQWLYVKGPFSSGWVQAEKIALCPRTVLADLESTPYLTVTRAKASLYKNADLTEYHGFARMGTRLFAAASPAPSQTFAVLLPVRRTDGILEFKTGYLPVRDAVQGCLAYTPRHIIEQAFEMLNTPYGWGGSRGEQDCSQFLQQVFACVGIHLPRNSIAQAETGQEGVLFSENAPENMRIATLLEKGQPGASILYMKGHVMLYLGTVDGRAYAIHDIWGYHAPVSRGGGIRIISRVTVSDLSLGQGSATGSILSRLQSIRLILPH